jgi:hypothetical protein
MSLTPCFGRIGDSMVKDITPAVYDLVPKRIRNKRKVKEALQNFQWIADFREALTLPVLLEYFDLYQELE